MKKHNVRKKSLAPQILPEHPSFSTPRSIWGRELRKTFRYHIRKDRYFYVEERMRMPKGREILKYAKGAAQRSLYKND